MKAFGIKLNVILYAALTAFCGLSYLCFADNFGSSLVGLWGAAAILVSCVILAKGCINPGEKLVGSELLVFCFIASCVMQAAPIMAWLSYGESGFELYGKIVPSFVANGIHFALILWGFLNVQLIKNGTLRSSNQQGTQGAVNG